MSTFTFLHAADLHLGSPLLGLALKDEDIARRFASAGRDAFRKLVDEAIAEKVAFVVIAGDIYDGEWKDASIGLFFNREVSRLERAGIPTFLVRGNHDAESVVTKSVILPDSVREFPTQAAGSFRLDKLGVVLHGRGFPERVVSENYALDYPPALPGWFNIGVLHTSCTGRPPHAVYAPCSPADLATRGYDYWALGHVHDHEIVGADPHIVYPGNIQGRSIRETGPKGAILVDVEDGRVHGLRRLITDQARWTKVTVDLTGVNEESAALRRAEQALWLAADEAQGRLLAARIEFVGTTMLHRPFLADARRLHDELQGIAHHAHEDVWIERVSQRTTAPAERPFASTVGGIDPAALILELEQDDELRSEARKLLATIDTKLPPLAPGDVALADDLDTLLTEATSLVLARFAREER